MKLYIARHGQDTDNEQGILNGHRDTDLTQKGQAQAQALAEGIQKLGLHFDAVYVSPLKRAFQTAQVVSQLNGFPDPIPLPDLIERDFGHLTGRPTSEIITLPAKDLIHTEKIIYFMRGEWIETFSEAEERAKRVLKKITDDHKGETILLVTHGDIGKALYAQYYHLSIESVIHQFYFGNSDLLELTPESGADSAHLIHIE